MRCFGILFVNYKTKSRKRGRCNNRAVYIEELGCVKGFLHQAKSAASKNSRNPAHFQNDNHGAKSL